MVYTLVEYLREKITVEDDPLAILERRRAEVSERIWRMRSSVPPEVYFADELPAYHDETAAMVERAYADEGLLLMGPDWGR